METNFDSLEYFRYNSDPSYKPVNKPIPQSGWKQLALDYSFKEHVILNRLIFSTKRSQQIAGGSLHGPSPEESSLMSLKINNCTFLKSRLNMVMGGKKVPWWNAKQLICWIIPRVPLRTPTLVYRMENMLITPLYY